MRSASTVLSLLACVAACGGDDTSGTTSGTDATSATTSEAGSNSDTNASSTGQGTTSDSAGSTSAATGSTGGSTSGSTGSTGGTTGGAACNNGVIEPGEICYWFDELLTGGDHLALDDFDGDGYTDLLIARAFPCPVHPGDQVGLQKGFDLAAQTGPQREGAFFGVVEVYPGDGEKIATTSEYHDLGQGFIDAMATGNWNDDGRADVFTLEEGQSSIFVYPSNTMDLDPALTYALSDTPTGLFTADLDDDGRTDILVTLQATGGFAMLPDGAMNTTVVGAPFALVELATATVTDDTAQDVVGLTAGVTPEVMVFAGNGLGGFAKAIELFPGLEVDRLHLGDMDGDDRVDILLVGQGSVSVLKNLGGSSFADPQTLATAAVRDSAMGTLGDDFLDDLFFVTETNDLQVIRGDTTWPIVPVDMGGPSASWPHLVAGAINDDGVTDLAYGQSVITAISAP